MVKTQISALIELTRQEGWGVFLDLLDSESKNYLDRLLNCSDNTQLWELKGQVKAVKEIKLLVGRQIERLQKEVAKQEKK